MEQVIRRLKGPLVTVTVGQRRRRKRQRQQREQQQGQQATHTVDFKAALQSRLRWADPNVNIENHDG